MDAYNVYPFISQKLSHANWLINLKLRAETYRRIEEIEND